MHQTEISNSVIETKRLLRTSSIELLKDSVKVKKSTPFESLEFELSYEHIETKKTVETKVNFGSLVLVLFLTIVGTLFFFGNTSGISTIFFIIALIVLIIAMVTKRRVITISSMEGKQLELYFNEKNKDEIISFADKIIDSTNLFLLTKYSKIDKDLPIDNQLANLSFLRNKNLISEEDFQHLKNQLLGKDNKQAIGYR